MLFSLCSLFLLLLQLACSQRIRFPGEVRRSNEPSSNVCDSNSQCRTLAACPALRASSNWRQDVQTCGFTRGERRRRLVCCPNQRPLRRTNRRQRPSTSQQTPRRPLSAPPDPIPNTIRTRPVSNSNCGISPRARLYSPYVMGGEFANQGDWPWMVAITMRDRQNRQSPWCTGFLIDRTHVLSAAHCFDRNQPNLYSTRIGHVNVSEGETYDVDRILVHEGYRPGFYYDDIALLTLSRPVDLPNVTPVCLPDANMRDLEGFGTTVAGWGAERSGGDMINRLKVLSSIPVVSNLQCDRTYRDRLSNFLRQFPTGISSGMICAGFPEGGRDSCGGDSGGPLMYQDEGRWFAVGLVSFGYACGRPGFPGGYTRLASYLGWIQRNIRS